LIEGEVISLQSVATWLRTARMWIICGAVLGAAVGLTASFGLTRTYRAEAVVVPVSNAEAGSGLSGLLSQFGGAASLVGLNAGSDEKAESMAVLNSRAIAEKFVVGHKLAPLLAKRRAHDGDNAQSQSALNVRAVNRFRKSVLVIAEDRRAGTVSIAIQWKDPVVAASWANDFLELVNADLRARAIDEAEIALGYLTKEAGEAPVLEVRQTLYRLAEGQLKTISMAKSRKDYAFRTIDLATVPTPDEFVSPNRALLFMGGGILGALVGAALVGLLRRRAVTFRVTAS